MDGGMLRGVERGAGTAILERFLIGSKQFPTKLGLGPQRAEL